MGGPGGYLSAPFDTVQSSYDVVIGLNEFRELAELMMKADPQAAIRAFGAAMQTAEIPAEQQAKTKIAV